ncbi:MAG TPA: SRPBCC family protein [Ilumatobacter sp.]|nr:SRPBCC family protein [Ilumatobacter sp.]
MSAHVSVNRDVAASADVVWEMVSDLPRMGEWSPENEGGAWIKGATGPAPGAAFRGSNRHGGKSWKSIATVVDAYPGRRFSFRVKALGLPVALWAYDITPTESGCVVTESWTDLRPGFFKPIAAKATGVSDRTAHNRVTMEQTLANLAAAAEASD